MCASTIYHLPHLLAPEYIWSVDIWCSKQTPVDEETAKRPWCPQRPTSTSTWTYIRTLSSSEGKSQCLLLVLAAGMGNLFNATKKTGIYYKSELCRSSKKAVMCRFGIRTSVNRWGLLKLSCLKLLAFFISSFCTVACSHFCSNPDC